MYVDSSDLHPLDVLLSKAKGKPAKLIAHAISGAYSHAAIVVTSEVLFDATPKGVGLRTFSLDVDKKPFSWYEGKALEVLSHSLLPHLSIPRRNELAAELATVCAGLSGKRYAAFSSLTVLGRRRWVWRLKQLFPRVLETAAEIVEWGLRTFDLILSSKSEKQWALFEILVPSDQMGQRFFCSEVVLFVFQQIGLPVAAAPVHESPLPQDLADRTKFFLDLRSIVCEGRPAKFPWPARTGAHDEELYKIAQRMRRDARQAMKQAPRVLGRFPDSERTNAVMSSFSEAETGSQAKHFWSAFGYRDAQVRRIAALNSLRSNLVDLISNDKQTVPLVCSWGSAANLYVNEQIEKSRQETPPEFVEFFSRAAPHFKPFEGLLEEIKANSVLISQLLTSCGGLCKSLI